MVFVDSHCHLEHPLFEKDVAEVVKRAQAGNTVCITYGSGAESNRRTLDLADRKTVFAACGQDAFHAKEDLEANIGFLEKNKSRLAAVGEIGLDQHYFSKEELPRQTDVLEAQLRFAEENSLAAVIHTRNAIPDVLQMLPSYSCTKVLHYFLDRRHASAALAQDCFLSLPTIKSRDRLAIIKQAPLERLLCETDAPFSWKGRNEPLNVREVYETIAETTGKPLDDVEGQIFENAEKVFKTK